MTTKKVTVNEGQSLMDLAVQEYGGIEGIFDLVQDNSLEGIQFKCATGQELKIYKEKAAAQDVKDFYTRKGATVNTRGSEGNTDLGIGQMAIGTTFIVR